MHREPDTGRLLQRFDAFVDEQMRAARAAKDAGRDPYPLEVKAEHSRRVLENGLLIAGAGTKGSDHSAIAAVCCYHDLGRFPQYVRWGTFRDALSTNHARLSVQALRMQPALLDGFDAPTRRAIMSAVFVHNRRDIPPTLRGLRLRLARIVRDADKTDILRILIAEFDNPKSEVVSLHLPYEAGRISQDILDEVLAGRICTYGKMRYANDFKVLLLSWVFDLNYDATRALWAERGLVEALVAQLPDTPTTRRVIRKVCKGLQG